MKWPGVWRRKEWAGEGKKEREEREKKEREKSRANHGKDWRCITKGKLLEYQYSWFEECLT